MAVIQCALRKLLTGIPVQKGPFSIKQWRSFTFTGRVLDDAKVKTKQLNGAVANEETEKVYQSIMRKVPQPVVVVTAAMHDASSQAWLKKGMTCTSFTSVSQTPPIISICIRNPSRMHDLLMQTQHFAVNVLAKHQATYGMTFAKAPPDDKCQFENIPHALGEEGIPVILGSCAVMECKSHSVHTVGDHHVWYGNVIQAYLSDTVTDPLLYFTRSFRSVGDEIFLQSFEDATLPFEDWTHEAHLRMAWNYITEFGREGAAPYIKSGIKKFNEQNKDKVKLGYHETITVFYIYMVSEAVSRTNNPECTFEEFLHQNGYLLDRSLMFQYYSKESVLNEEAKRRFILPDIKNLPGLDVG